MANGLRHAALVVCRMVRLALICVGELAKQQKAGTGRLL